MAGLLAQQDFRASAEVLAHPDGGIFNAYSDGGKPEVVVAGLGREWLLQQIALRLWPAASSIQTAITGLFALVERHDLKPDDIAELRVGLSQTVYDMHGTLPWNDKFKALLSAPYVMGIIVHDRRCWLDQFEPRRYQDTAVGRFTRERVKVSADPSLQGTAATVEVRMRNGAVHTDRRDCAKGDPGDPLTRAEIQQKLRIAAEGKLPAARIARVIALVDRLETLADVRELTAALRA